MKKDFDHRSRDSDWTDLQPHLAQRMALERPVMSMSVTVPSCGAINSSSFRQRPFQRIPRLRESDAGKYELASAVTISFQHGRADVIVRSRQRGIVEIETM
jgi:hypothetical protein